MSEATSGIKLVVLTAAPGYRFAHPGYALACHNHGQIPSKRSEMAISDVDIKVLWGRAAGICSNPQCRKDLTVILAKQGSYNIGEMAHIIARSVDGPRGQTQPGADTYDNLILLCPTCHTLVDKGPSQYPPDLLHRWKADHEKEIREAGSSLKFDDVAKLKSAVTKLLQENYSIWKSLGPKSDIASSDPGSNASDTWGLRKLDAIIPNNSKIINMVQNNLDLLSDKQYEALLSFKNHAAAFEQNQYGRLDNYPTFPAAFESEFKP
jgi:5-methylcytosine-specific restriction endonuclease McrA